MYRSPLTPVSTKTYHFKMVIIKHPCRLTPQLMWCCTHFNFMFCSILHALQFKWFEVSRRKTRWASQLPQYQCRCSKCVHSWKNKSENCFEPQREGVFQAVFSIQDPDCRNAFNPPLMQYFISYQIVVHIWCAWPQQNPKNKLPLRTKIYVK